MIHLVQRFVVSMSYDLYILPVMELHWLKAAEFFVTHRTHRFSYSTPTKIRDTKAYSTLSKNNTTSKQMQKITTNLIKKRVIKIAHV